MPKALLIYPEFPPSYWSEKYALRFIGRRAAMPPLGLLTVAALFPAEWNLKVIDMNVEALTDKHIEAADFVFISSMIVQRRSFEQVVRRCRAKGKCIIAGGPYATSFHDEIEGVDHLVLGEIEDYFADFLADLLAGRAAPIYRPKTDAAGQPERPDISASPPPRYDLIKLRYYNSMAIQFSRGCPFDCEFCDITKLFGRRPRTKRAPQVLHELDLLYERGWRGSVFFVDDNFIGNRRSAELVLPEVTRWQRAHGYPFFFFTEASVNLADMPELMDEMAAAGFDMVFLGLETPNPETLQQINKRHNVSADNPDYLYDVVQRIQQHGMEVSAGFILGLDGDDEHVFDSQVSFIQKAGIPTAMVGLLTALKGTDLYRRFKKENRLVDESTGNNVSAELNFIPRMDRQVLIEGYKRVLSTLYDANLSNYFDRCYTLIKNWNHQHHARRHIRLEECLAFLRSMRTQLFSRQGPAYLKFLTKVLSRRPRMFAEAIRLGIMGYHYQRVTSQQLMVDEFLAFLEQEYRTVKEMLGSLGQAQSARVAEVQLYIERRLSHLKRRYRSVDAEFRAALDDALESFVSSVQRLGLSETSAAALFH